MISSERIVKVWGQLNSGTKGEGSGASLLKRKARGSNLGEINSA